MENCPYCGSYPVPDMEPIGMYSWGCGRRVLRGIPENRVLSACPTLEKSFNLLLPNVQKLERKVTTLTKRLKKEIEKIPLDPHRMLAALTKKVEAITVELQEQRRIALLTNDSQSALIRVALHVAATFDEDLLEETSDNEHVPAVEPPEIVATTPRDETWRDLK